MTDNTTIAAAVELLEGVLNRAGNYEAIERFVTQYRLTRYDAVSNPGDESSQLVALVPSGHKPAGEAAWRCQQCGELLRQNDPRWRWTGEVWQHCHDYVGHVDATNFGTPLQASPVVGKARTAERTEEPGLLTGVEGATPREWWIYDGIVCDDIIATGAIRVREVLGCKYCDTCGGSGVVHNAAGEFLGDCYCEAANRESFGKSGEVAGQLVPSCADLIAPAQVLENAAHPFTVWLREFDTATHGLLFKTMGNQVVALNAWNAALTAASPLHPTNVAVDAVALDQFNEAIAWGATYFPEIPKHQWNEMRSAQAKLFVERLAARQQPVADHE